MNNSLGQEAPTQQAELNVCALKAGSSHLLQNRTTLFQRNIKKKKKRFHEFAVNFGVLTIFNTYFASQTF